MCCSPGQGFPRAHGCGAGLLIAGYLGPALGWRNCFYVIGLAGLALRADGFDPAYGIDAVIADFAVGQSREAVETLWSCYGAQGLYKRDPDRKSVV